jgi:hypothetical protein
MVGQMVVLEKMELLILVAVVDLQIIQEQRLAVMVAQVL